MAATAEAVVDLDAVARNAALLADRTTAQLMVVAPLSWLHGQRFWKPGHAEPVDGLAATWIDTNGATNVKWSEYNPAVLAFHEAHVEAAEQGVHEVIVSDQAGCAVASVKAGGKTYAPAGGTVTVRVLVKNHATGDATYFVDVACAG